MLVRPKQCDCGVTVWLAGSPNAGTSALAHALAEQLRGAGHRVAVLDAGDRRRVGLAAEVLARNGVIVVVVSVAPYADGSGAVRERHGRSGTHFLEVHVATSTAVPGPSGADGSYGPPYSPDLVIPAHAQSAGRPALLLELLTAKRFVGGAR